MVTGGEERGSDSGTMMGSILTRGGGGGMGSATDGGAMGSITGGGAMGSITGGEEATD